MGHISPEYGYLRQDLAAWFADRQWQFADQQAEPVYAGPISSGSVDRYGPAWEIRAGTIGDEYLSCSGLAVVVRRGMQEQDGVYRVDVYDLQPAMRDRLPAPDDRAARLFYGPTVAGLAESRYPDAPPDRKLSTKQFKTMQLLMQHLSPYNRDTVASWAQAYERLLGASQPVEGTHPLLLILEQGLRAPKTSNGEAA